MVSGFSVVQLQVFIVQPERMEEERNLERKEDTLTVWTRSEGRHTMSECLDYWRVFIILLFLPCTVLPAMSGVWALAFHKFLGLTWRCFIPPIYGYWNVGKQLLQILDFDPNDFLMITGLRNSFLPLHFLGYLLIKPSFSSTQDMILPTVFPPQMKMGEKYIMYDRHIVPFGFILFWVV